MRTSISEMNEMDKSRNFLIFKSGGRYFACDFQSIIRIEPAGEIFAAPGLPDYMPGACRIDGEVMLVIDAAKRFGLTAADRSRSCLITAMIKSRAPFKQQNGEEYTKCALLVDSVEGSQAVAADKILPPPAANSDSFVKYLTGVIELHGEVGYVIDPGLTIGD